MKQVAVIALLLLVGVIFVNGIRLTFFPGSVCNSIPFVLPEIPPAGQSILYHHEN